MKVTLHHAGGAEQTVMLRAGHEFADYVRRLDVPGSVFAEGIVNGRQVRTFGVRVERGEVLEKVVLESPMSRVAATTVAVTAELREGAVVLPEGERKREVPAVPVPVPAPVPAPEGRAPGAAAGGGADDPRSTVATGQRFGEERGRLRVLLAGAGGAHDFPRYFLKADGAMLKADGGCDVVATPNAEEAQARLGEADVLVFSANHPSFSRVPFMTALHGFADGGKGVVILHAGTWRNYAVHTGFNQRFVGGGAKGHGHGEFEVTVKDAGHPVMAGLPGTFRITDESYHAVLDAGVPVRVLAENAPDSKTMKVYPSVWVVEDAKTRVVNISLGHAGPAHENPAFRRLLLNAVRWAGRMEGK
jgi:type 1 glutamine amidotransferase